MDLDNTGENNSGGVDIEQSLLQQFSCMGTTDRDELVSQLQKVIGANINYSTAVFFLDMNNWNLQGAICSYFDVENTTQLPSMSIAFNPSANENESIEPNTSFRKAWTFINNGNEAWPMGCYLQFAGGDMLEAQRQLVPCLKPGESVEVSVDFRSPSQPGMYQSKWRLCTSTGSYFGDPMWLIITVVEEGTMALTDQLSHLSDLGSPGSHNVNTNPFRPSEQLQNTSSNDTDTHMC